MHFEHVSRVVTLYARSHSSMKVHQLPCSRLQEGELLESQTHVLPLRNRLCAKKELIEAVRHQPKFSAVTVLCSRLALLLCLLHPWFAK